MNIYILDKLIKYENTQRSADEMFEYINEVLMSTGFVLSGMNIDGVNVYEDYYGYVIEHLDKVDNIKIEVMELEAAIINTIELAEGYLRRAVPELEGLADAFYFGADENAYIDKLGQLFEGIQWMIEVGQSITDYSKLNDGKIISKQWNAVINDMQRLSVEFTNIKDAVLNMDRVLIGDIIRYEIKEILEAIEANFKIILGR